jgi:hypothetical protein
VEARVGKTPYVRFDLNDYTVPHTHVRRRLTVLADPDRLRIVDGQDVLAAHPRSYDRHQQIEDPAHLQALVDAKRQARHHRATDRLVQAAPASRTFLLRAAERGHNLGNITATLARLLERYGPAQLDAAIIEALDRDVPHPNTVRLALERQRDDRGRPPPVALVLPARATRPCSRIPSTPTINSARWAMNHPDALQARAKALNMHGSLAHWPEALAGGWAAALIGWEEEERARRSLERRTPPSARPAG